MCALEIAGVASSGDDAVWRTAACTEDRGDETHDAMAYSLIQCGHLLSQFSSSEVFTYELDESALISICDQGGRGGNRREFGDRICLQNENGIKLGAGLIWVSVILQLGAEFRVQIHLSVSIDEPENELITNCDQEVTVVDRSQSLEQTDGAGEREAAVGVGVSACGVGGDVGERASSLQSNSMCVQSSESHEAGCLAHAVDDAVDDVKVESGVDVRERQRSAAGRACAPDLESIGCAEVMSDSLIRALGETCVSMHRTEDESAHQDSYRSGVRDQLASDQCYD